MPVLALDTSSAVAVALTDDSGRPLAARSSPEQRHHAELLAPMIAGVLADAGVDRRELTAVVAGTGPAPYTGLRVGLVTARALALALGVPVHGVSSLDALAAQAVADLGLEAGTEVLVATDARRREVYWALYRAAVQPLAPDGTAIVRVDLVDGPAVGTAAAVAAASIGGRARDAVVVGRGASLYAADLPPVPGAPLDPDPARLAALALDRLVGTPVGTVLTSEPLYLRRPDAVPPAERKRALA